MSSDYSNMKLYGSGRNSSNNNLLIVLLVYAAVMCHIEFDFRIFSQQVVVPSMFDVATYVQESLPH